MTTSLTELFVNAQRERTDWSSRLHDVLDNLKVELKATDILWEENRQLRAGIVFDWEQKDESWARFIERNQAILLINALVPIVVVHRDFYHRIHQYTSGCQIVSVESFHQANYCVDKRVLCEIYGSELTDVINYENASIMDIWYATVI